jgi:hypothetical protein
MVALNAELVDLEQKNKYLEDELSATNVQARPFMQFNVWCVFVSFLLFSSPVHHTRYVPPALQLEKMRQDLESQLSAPKTSSLSGSTGLGKAAQVPQRNARMRV